MALSEQTLRDIHFSMIKVQKQIEEKRSNKCCLYNFFYSPQRVVFEQWKLDCEKSIRDFTVTDIRNFRYAVDALTESKFHWDDSMALKYLMELAEEKGYDIHKDEKPNT